MTVRDSEGPVVTSATTSDGSPRVAMIVANDISIDGRVRKTAATVAAMGLDVTLIGLSSTQRVEGWTGGIPTVWVPVKGTFVRAARDGRYRPDRRDADRGRRIAARLFARRHLDSEAYVYERSRHKLALRSLNGNPTTLDLRTRTSPLLRTADRHWFRIRKRLRTLWIRARIIRLDRRYARQREDRVPRRKPGSAEDQLRQSINLRLAQLDDWELAFGPELDRLQPDVIHVHDVQLLGVAVRYKARRRLTQHAVKVIYDAHEYVRGQAHINRGSHQVMVAQEDEYAPHVDEIVTVSPLIAEWLAADLGLDTSSICVVLNTPAATASATSHEAKVSVREAIGLDADVPLVTYSGGQTEQRGVTDLVDAIGELDGIHCVLVAKPSDRFALSQLDVAKQRGYGDRVHVAGFVAPERVSEYLDSADLAVHPLRRFADGELGSREVIANHDAALANKLFEYLHARLPMVVSDCRAMSEFVSEHAVGVVFRAGDVAHLAACISAAFEQRAQLRENITDELVASYTWESQSGVICEIYRRVTGSQR